MDFLTFKDFISIPVLIGFYYMGAVVMPIFMWFFSTWLIKKFGVIADIHKAGKDKLWGLLTSKQSDVSVYTIRPPLLLLKTNDPISYR